VVRWHFAPVDVQKHSCNRQNKSGGLNVVSRRQRFDRQAFLYIELTTKAPIHALRAKLQPVK
jgi:hypothetical protein